MSFGKPKKVKAPKATAPAVKAVSLDEDVLQKERDKRRQRIAASGRAGTILTGLGGLGTKLGGTA